ncbi:unnamed protein product, partial [Chrysoparadoxa australica]
VRLLGQGGWEGALHEMVDPSQLPKDYGGQLAELAVLSRDESEAPATTRSSETRAAGSLPGLKVSDAAKETGNNAGGDSLGEALIAATVLVATRHSIFYAQVILLLRLIYHLYRACSPNHTPQRKSLSADKYGGPPLLHLNRTLSKRIAVASPMPKVKTVTPRRASSQVGAPVSRPTLTPTKIRRMSSPRMSLSEKAGSILRDLRERDVSPEMRKKASEGIAVEIVENDGAAADVISSQRRNSMFQDIMDSTSFLLPHEHNAWILANASSASGNGPSSDGGKRTSFLYNAAMELGTRLTHKVSDKTHQLLEGRQAARLFGKLLKVDLVTVQGPREDHVVGVAGGRVSRNIQELIQSGRASFIHVLCFQIPPERRGPARCLVLYYDWPIHTLTDGDDADRELRDLIMRYIDLPLHNCGANTALRRPGQHSHDFQNESIKIIPVVRQGNWLVKQTVDSGFTHRLAKHLTLRYFKGLTYMETDVDLGSTAVGRNALSILLKEAENGRLSMDIGLYLEGSRSILGAVRVNNLNLSSAVPLVENTGPSDSVPFAFTRPELKYLFSDAGSVQRMKVRGPTYVNDRCLEEGAPAAGTLVHVDLFDSTSLTGVRRVEHIVTKGRCKDSLARLRKAFPPEQWFMFVVNLQDPRLHCVLYWAVPASAEGGRLEMQRFHKMFSKFIDIEMSGEDSEGNLPSKSFQQKRLKMFVDLKKAPWLVETVVGGGPSQPLLISDRLKIRYFRGEGYMEVDVDIASSALAFHATSLVLDRGKRTELDIGWCIQGEVSEELPERLLGVVRMTPVGAVAAAELLYGEEETAEEGETEEEEEEEEQPVPLELADMFRSADEEGKGSGPMRDNFYDSAMKQTFQVRGPTYLNDHLKTPADGAEGSLLHVDFFVIDAPIGRTDHIAVHGGCLETLTRLRTEKKGLFIFMVQLQMPGDPPTALICYWGIPAGLLDAGACQGLPEDRAKFAALLREFADLPQHEGEEDPEADIALTGQFPLDDLRNARIKLLANILEGPWIVKKAVGGKPALIAQKLMCRWFRGQDYLELDVDIASSSIAYRTTGLAMTYAKNIVCDIGFTIQGESDGELPERLLGVVRIDRLNVANAASLYSTICGGADLKRSTELLGSIATTTAVTKPSTAQPAAPSELALVEPELDSMVSDSGEEAGYMIRGPTYDVDKVKVPCESTTGKLLRVDMYYDDDPTRMEDGRRMDHVTGKGAAQSVLEAVEKAHNGFVFVLNLQLPAGGTKSVSIMMYWGLDIDGEEGLFKEMLTEMIDIPLCDSSLDPSVLTGEREAGDFRTARLKLFPAIVQGPWILRKAVPNRPCLLAQKLTCRWFRGERYLECCVDIGSSAIALRTTSLAMGYATVMAIDMGIALQADSPEELPERVIGSVRFSNIDVELARPLYPVEG